MSKISFDFPSKEGWWIVLHEPDGMPYLAETCLEYHKEELRMKIYAMNFDHQEVSLLEGDMRPAAYRWLGEDRPI